MKDYYKNTRACINEYNRIINKVITDEQELTDKEEEKLDNHCLYLAHALLKDTGPAGTAREELEKMCDVIKDVII